MSRQVRTKSPWFSLVAVAVVVFVIFSAAKALATADACESSPQGQHRTWQFFPPEWVCGR